MGEFTRRSQKRIADTVTAFEKRKLSTSGRPSKGIPHNQGSVLVKTPPGGIQARSGGTIHSAGCDIQTLDKTNGGLASGSEIACWNLSDEALAPNSYFMAKRDRGGAFIIDQNNNQSVGLFRIQFTQALADTDDTAQGNVEKSDLAGVSGAIVADNLLSLESDLGGVGYCWLYNDETIELIAAECPEGS